MSALGSQLRQSREALELSIEQASFHTRIQPIYLECLEQGEYSLFASAAYAKSFLRKYSQFLELDIEAHIRSLEIVGYAPPSTHNLITHESLKEKLESTDDFAEDIKRYRNTEDVKGSPVFLVGSIVFSMVAMASFYYFGSQANIAANGATRQVIDFEKISQSFSRKREVVEHTISSINTATIATAQPIEVAPLANIRETSFAAEEKPQKAIPVTQPIATIDPVSDL